MNLLKSCGERIYDTVDIRRKDELIPVNEYDDIICSFSGQIINYKLYSMKAKIKKTGEIIEVRHLNVRLGNEIIAKGYVNVSNSEDVYDCDELEIMQEKSDCIDWEQRRYEIAKAAMIGNLAAPVVDGIDPNPSIQQLVRHSVMLADALIEELKKGIKE